MAGVWRRHWKRYTAIMVVSIALVIGLILEADPSQLAGQLYHVDLTLLAAVIVFYLASLALRAARWYLLLLASDNRVRVSNTFIQYSVAQALNDLTPIKVLGEGYRVWRAHKEEGVPIGSGVATIFAEKIMDLVFVSIVLIASVVLLFPDLSLGSWSSLTVIVSLVVAANLVLIIILRRPDLVEKLGRVGVKVVGWMGRPEWTSKLDGMVHRTASSFERALVASQGTNRGLTALAAVLTVPIWGLEFARIAFIIAALGSVASFPAVVVASTLALTAQVFLPAGSGNVAVISDVFAAMGVALATATAAGLLSIATSIWISVPVAIAALVISGRRLNTEELEQADLI